MDEKICLQNIIVCNDCRNLKSCRGGQINISWGRGEVLVWNIRIQEEHLSAVPPHHKKNQRKNANLVSKFELALSIE